MSGQDYSNTTSLIRQEFPDAKTVATCEFSSLTVRQGKVPEHNVVCTEAELHEAQAHPRLLYSELAVAVEARTLAEIERLGFNTLNSQRGAQALDPVRDGLVTAEVSNVAGDLDNNWEYIRIRYGAKGWRTQCVTSICRWRISMVMFLKGCRARPVRRRHPNRSQTVRCETYGFHMFTSIKLAKVLCNIGWERQRSQYYNISFLYVSDGTLQITDIIWNRCNRRNDANNCGLVLLHPHSNYGSFPTNRQRYQGA